MQGLLLTVMVLLLIGLGTYAAFVMMVKMNVDSTIRWIITILIFIALVVVFNQYIGLF